MGYRLKQAIVLFGVVLVLCAYAWIYLRESKPEPLLTFNGFYPSELTVVDLSTHQFVTLFKEAHRKPEITVIHYWASWCETCVQELPQLLRFFEQRTDIAVHFISLDTSFQDVKRLLSVWLQQKSRHISYYVDTSGQLGFEWGSLTLPTTFFMNNQGFVFERWLGPQSWMSERISRRLDELRLAVQAQTAGVE